MDILDQLLSELSTHMGVPLKADSHLSCLIRFKNKINIQIELDKPQEHLIAGIFLGELTPGAYRENILREALKSNNEPPPAVGIFAYSDRKNGLVLFETRRVQDINGDKLHSLLLELYVKAEPWQEALSRGEIPHVTRRSMQGAKSDSIFNLKL